MRNSKVGPAYLHFPYIITKEYLWVHGLFNPSPSWVVQELSGRGLARAHDKDEGTAFVALLRSCAKNKDLCRGTRVHDAILKRGLLGKCSDALVTMYAKCGALATAKKLLDMLKSRNVFSWTALIAAYVQKGQGQDALICFEQMQRKGVSPIAVTFTCILQACGSIGAADKGEQIHEEIARQGLLGNNIILGNSLVNMYAKCGAVAKARRVLEELPVRNVISWSALIAGYAEHGEGEQALKCYEEMQREGLSPEAVIFTCILKACGSIGAADMGQQIHDEIAKQGLLGNNILLGTSLVAMYAKCGELVKARQVLDELPMRNATSWNALITGYAQHGEGEQALKCFEVMQHEGFSPDSVTFTSILKACASVGAADKGEEIHEEIAKQGLLAKDIVLGTALVDMYAKCGALVKARGVLEELPVRNAISWNALIAGYVRHGEGKQALNCFEEMQCEKLSPNAATFASVLSACSRLGLVERAQMYFVNMSVKYGEKPDIEHYSCMVDLFGRAGQLHRAIGLIEKTPSMSGLWPVLLGACCKWGDVNVGRWAFEHATQVDKSDGVVYALMANIYAAAGMQEDAKSIEAMRIENNAWNNTTHSRWMDMRGNLCSFFVGEESMRKRITSM